VAERKHFSNHGACRLIVSVSLVCAQLPARLQSGVRRRRTTQVARPPRAVKEDDKRTVEGFDTEAESFADSELFGNLLKARPRPARLYVRHAQAGS